MFIVRAVQHGNLLIISLSIKFSKFPRLPESTPESTLLDMRVQDRAMLLPHQNVSEFQKIVSEPFPNSNTLSNTLYSGLRQTLNPAKTFKKAYCQTLSKMKGNLTKMFLRSGYFRISRSIPKVPWLRGTFGRTGARSPIRTCDPTAWWTLTPRSRAREEGPSWGPIGS